VRERAGGIRTLASSAISTTFVDAEYSSVRGVRKSAGRTLENYVARTLKIDIRDFANRAMGPRTTLIHQRHKAFKHVPQKCSQARRSCRSRRIASLCFRSRLWRWMNLLNALTWKVRAPTSPRYGRYSDRQQQARRRP
jgi:hypothetical protein